MSNYVVLGCSLQSYVNKRGEEVNRCNIQYFDPKGKSNSSLYRGYTILSRDVFPDFSSEDFLELPGGYDLEFRQKPAAFGKKASSKLVKVGFEKALVLSSSYPDSYIVLGVQKIDFVAQDKSRVKGIAVYYVDPFALDSDLRGLACLRNFSARVSYEQFQVVPGCYDLSFEEYQGKFGAETRLASARYLGSPNFGDRPEELKEAS